MAERSFRKEVQSLRLGAGDEFRGEGILAVTKALLQSGVAYVGGYQGAPISHLMDVLADAEEILNELGVHFEASASEATAAAMLAASINYPLRGAVTWKSTVGTNVASDALSNLASAGVKGGALIILGEDYGEGASIMQERTHAFAMKSQMWLLDPRPRLADIVRTVELGFELSEASHTPVMLMLRIRACHVYGRFAAQDNRRPTFSAADALAQPRRDYGRIILPPSTYAQEREKIEQRLPAAQRFIAARGLNELIEGEVADIGIVAAGRSVQQHAACPRAARVCRRVRHQSRATLRAERHLSAGRRGVAALLQRQAGGADRRGGAAGVHRAGGQPDPAPARCGLRACSARDLCPCMASTPSTCCARGSASSSRAGHRRRLRPRAPGAREVPLLPAAKLAALVPARPSGLCTGCPERPFFSALKLLQKETGPLHISADIGCHSFATLPPFNMGNSIMGYGLGAAAASAFGAAGGRRAVSVMGDGGFWHNGLTSGVGNAVFNKHDDVTIIIDNGYSAATGGQDIPSSRRAGAHRQGNNSIVDAVRGVGVRWVRRTDTYDMRATLKVLREALSSSYHGPKVIVAEGECQLNRQRRVRPLLRKAVADGERVVTQRFGVDPDTCTGDHSCIRLSGCPSLTVKDNPDPLRSDPVAHIDNSCVGCGVCGEVADAATLCPSFYRAELIENPTRWDRCVHALRAAIIGMLQRRSERRRLRRAL